MRGGAAVLAGAALLAACDRAPPPPPPANQTAPAAINVIRPASDGCADGWIVALDPDSFANNGAGRHFAATRLGLFRDQLEKSVRGAMNSACTEGVVAPSAAKFVKSLAVRSASGASDPTFSAGKDQSALRLEWSFAENDLTIPSEMELRDGLVCWSAPQSDQCAEREP